MDYQRYQQRKRCWLIFGRAFLTVAILGIVTVCLYLLSHKLHNDQIASTKHVRERRDVNLDENDRNLDRILLLNENPTENVHLDDVNPVKKAFSKHKKHKRRQHKPKIKYINSYLNHTDLNDLQWDHFHNHTADDLVLEKVRHKKHGMPSTIVTDKKYIYVTRYKCRPGGPAYYHRRGCVEFMYRCVCEEPVDPPIQLYRKPGCNCHIHGSVDRLCDYNSGQCKCRNNVEGRRCNSCRKGFWNIDSKHGCAPCSCDPYGSDEEGCDIYTGQCYCRPGVGGQNCDRCLHGFYGFSHKGCKECDQCEGPTFVCDPDTGRCICPPNTIGHDCRECAPFTYGYELQKGCKHCECNRAGSIGNSCDAADGQCICKEGFAGRKCDQCAVGYYGYPNCKKCGCDSRGSLTNHDGVIDCDENGQCNCKALVYGEKCNLCKESTFGISEKNSEGCTRCFCFGRSQDCQQSEYSWGQVRLQGSRNLSVVYMDRTPDSDYEFEYVVVIQLEGTKTFTEDADIQSMNGLGLIPKSNGNVSIGSYGAFNEPLYFQLPPQFLGDKVASYGGNLNFTLSTNGAYRRLQPSIFRQYPLVQLHTHDKLILDYFEAPKSEILDCEEQFSVSFHENLWRYHANGQNITRSMMMTALQNIKHVFLRGTTTEDFTQVVISNVTMDTGIYISGIENHIAIGVEKCSCSSMFSGLSCQDPGPGYYRNRTSTNDIDYPTIDDLVGQVVPCSCNDRSESCDKETGHCYNCRGNTGGLYCEKCAEGYYGNPFYGSCEPCPCPETRKNFAKGCHVRDNAVNCFCKQGYIGPLCDKCDVGYYGTPHQEDGRCDPCDCNEDGSESNECDIYTGQCMCKLGVIGQKCDRCEAPRHILHEQSCKPCDNCTVTLLDDLEMMNFKLDRDAGHLDTNGIPAPWFEIEKFEQQYDMLATNVSDMIRVKDHFENFDDEKITTLKKNATKLNKKVNKLSNKIGIRQGDIEKIVILTNELKGNSSMELDIIKKTIDDLNSYGTVDHHIKPHEALRESQELLNQIQFISDQKNNPDFLCAYEQYNHWSNMSDLTGAQRAFLERLHGDFAILNGKFGHFDRFIHDVFHQSAEAEVYQTKNREKMDNLIRKNNEIHELIDETDKILNWNILGSTNFTIDQIVSENFVKLESNNKNLENLNSILETTLEEFNEAYKAYNRSEIPLALEYSQELKERADDYRDRFASTEHGAANAMKASTAYENITAAITEANKLAEEAVIVAKEANEKVDPLHEEAMLAKSEEIIEDSAGIIKEALEEVEYAEVVNNDMIVKEKAVDSLKKMLWNLGIQNNVLRENMSSLSNDNAMHVIKQSLDTCAKVSDQMKEVRNEAVQISADVYKLKLKLANLEPDWDSKYGLAEENVSQTMSNIRNANNKLSAIETLAKNQTEHFKRMNSSISAQLQELRDKIARAKHTAEGIRVTLESKDPKCIRSYMPTSFGPLTTNKIILSIALNSKSATSPLLFIQGESNKFIALELVKRKIKLIWNLGGDVGTITHPTEIMTRDPKYDDAWYQIEANRTMNLCSLNVKRMTNDGVFEQSTAITKATSPEYTRLTIDPNNRIWVGGIPDDIRPQELMTNNGLGVILHQLFVDQRHIGLWHFSTTEGQCSGAMQGPQEISYTQNARHFNGEGYAVLKTRSRRKKTFDFQLNFKTLDENALLFLAVDEKNNRSISLTLFEGRVVFRVDYGGESKLEINTTNKYNTGQWVKLDAARVFHGNTENGRLKINDDVEIHSGAPTSPINSSLLPDLSNAFYYIGGVPPGFKSGITKAPGADHAFLGCTKDIVIQGETYDPLDSSNNFGVEKSCNDVITRAGFYGNGYVELPSHSLKKRSNFGFVFRTLQPECLLLLSAFPPAVSEDYDAKDVKGNYSVSMFDGRIHLWMDAGRGKIEIVSNVTLNDGEYHVLSVIKTTRRVEMRIDDELQGVKNLPSSPTLVNAPEGNGGLYVGGAPEFEEYDLLAKSFVGFEGAITNIVFNNRTVTFDQAINFTNVNMGRMGPNMGSDGLHKVMNTEPIGKSFKPPPEGCHKVGSYSYEPHAFKYGDKPKSHSVVTVAQRNLWQRNFNIQFDFRTFYPDGVLFVAPGSKEKQKHFIVLTLRDGVLHLMIKGRAREEQKLPVKLNDGQWHHVTLSSMKKKATLSVENGSSRSSVQIKLPKKLNAAHTIYVGGIPDDKIPLPAEMFTKLEEFKGCLRRFSVNNSTQDLARPGRHLNVGQCFPRIEQGSYFPGDAYAVYKRNFNVGKLMELDLEFRTSEMNGILISISEPNGFPALSLEVYNGKIVMSADTGDGNPFRVETNLPSKYTLCDNRWHNISSIYNGLEIGVKIDNNPTIFSNYRVGGGINVDKIYTKSPMYIGGLPDTAPSGTLLMRENFKGCIRNVVIRGERKDWTDMDSLQNVLLSECLAVK